MNLCSISDRSFGDLAKAVRLFMTSFHPSDVFLGEILKEDYPNQLRFGGYGTRESMDE